MRTLSILIAIALAGTGCASGYKVHKITPNSLTPLDKPALYYALPRSVVKVRATVTKKTVERGPCSDVPSELFPKEYNEKKEAIGTKINVGTTFSLGDLTIENGFEPDPDEIYAIELSNKFLKKIDRGFELSEMGTLDSSTMSSESQAVAAAIKTVNVLVSTAAAAFGGPLPERATNEDKSKRKKVCKDVEERIKEIRTARYELAAGWRNTNGVSKDTIELMLSELKLQEAAYSEHFTGTTFLTKSEVVCEFRPKTSDSEDWTDLKLFKFNPSEGVLKPNMPDKGVDCVIPAAATAKGNQSGSKSPTEMIVLKYKKVPGMAEAVKNAIYEKGDGPRHRIPGEGDFRLYKRKQGDSTNLIARKQLIIPQFGIVAVLPGDSDTKSMSANFALKFHPSGALASYSSMSASIDPTILDEAGKVGAGAASAWKGYRDGKKVEPADPLKELEAEKARLELERDIRLLRLELESDGSTESNDKE